MRYEVTVNYSEPLLRKTVARYIFQSLGWLFIVALILVLISFLSLVIQGERGWYVGVIGAVFVFALFFPIWGYIVHVKRMKYIIGNMPSRKANFIFEEDGFSVESEAGSGALKWSTVTEIRRMKEVWLLFQNRYTYNTLPLEHVGENVREFILSKVKEAGGKIS